MRKEGREEDSSVREGKGKKSGRGRGSEERRDWKRRGEIE